MVNHTCFNCAHLKIVYDVNCMISGHVKICKAKGKKVRCLHRGLFCKDFKRDDMTYPEKLWELQRELDKYAEKW